MSLHAENGFELRLLNDLIPLAQSIKPSQDAEAIVLSQRTDRLVVRFGEVVIKVHASGQRGEDLRARLQLLAETPLNDTFLTPLRYEIFPVAGDRFATLWPAGFPVNSERDGMPWEAAGQLLANLHRSPKPVSLSKGVHPECRAKEKVFKALAKLKALQNDPEDQAVQAVYSAAQTLSFSKGSPVEPTTLVHGDWHFGQLLRLASSGEKNWLLIDIDDMGLGNPAWDLARPAAFFAAGLISSDDWGSFLDAYRAAQGPAVPAVGDPWVPLDMPARALVIQCAASAILRAQDLERQLNDAEWPLIDACQRIACINI